MSLGRNNFLGNNHRATDRTMFAFRKTSCSTSRFNRFINDFGMTPDATHIEVIPCITNQHQTGDHGTALIKVIPRITQTEPSSHHGTALSKIVPSITNTQPTGHHGAALVKIIPRITYRQPAGNHGTAFIKIIPSIT